MSASAWSGHSMSALSRIVVKVFMCWFFPVVGVRVWLGGLAVLLCSSVSVAACDAGRFVCTQMSGVSGFGAVRRCRSCVPYGSDASLSADGGPVWGCCSGPHADRFGFSDSAFEAVGGDGTRRADSYSVSDMFASCRKEHVRIHATTCGLVAPAHADTSSAAMSASSCASTARRTATSAACRHGQHDASRRSRCAAYPAGVPHLSSSSVVIGRRRGSQRADRQGHRRRVAMQCRR